MTEEYSMGGDNPIYRPCRNPGPSPGPIERALKKTMAGGYETVDGVLYVGEKTKGAGRWPTLLAVLMALVAGLMFGAAVFELLVHV